MRNFTPGTTYWQDTAVWCSGDDPALRPAAQEQEPDLRHGKAWL
jgi:hypothetical protein